ncbi:Dihydroorotase [Planctomycetes bacterium Pan216]|uniref:Dihydroorotase n=1 Tax=Kolteria novifilia TaxID=2527975 RepID=A0A518BB31_9BACT|nr:Dihydroorotase [Planctomycetes bacterium Pan216]
MKRLRLRGGRVVDPSQDLDASVDVWIEEGKIASIDADPDWVPDETVDASGLLIVPGLIDMHVHLREPGYEADETIASGTRAAVESGFTSLACMPDGDPAVDNQASAEFVTLQAHRAGFCHVWPVGAVTKGRSGQELSEMGGLVDGGAVALSDSDRPVANAEIMRRALQYAQMFDTAILSHAEVSELTRAGVMNEGFISMKLGMVGMPAAAEEIHVDRDIHLAQLTGGRVHFQSLSCAGSVASLRRAKEAGLRVTGEVNPHHLALTEEALTSFDSVYKVNPPLRTGEDVAALIEGLRDGTIDVLASGHSPRATEQKMRELDLAPFGVIGIESLLPVAVKTLIEPGHLDWSALVQCLSVNPARILGIDRGTLRPGSVADVTLLDPEERWVLDPSKFHSLSRNCPFAGWAVRGRARYVVVQGGLFRCSPRD